MQEFIKDFVRDADGAWTCVTAVDLDGPTGRIQVTPGARFTPGTRFMGIDLALWLDEQARDGHAER
jgi:hypothetical protein